MPTADFFQAVKAAFPWVNIEWLITGIGEMEVQADGRALSISTRAAALANNFEALSEEDKRAIERTAFALAESGKKVKKKTG